ncbi:MAG: response regulator [Myxococcota bacterium]
MIEELRARFGPRFVATARERVRCSLELLSSTDGSAQLVNELHSLAGEAAMLGLNELSDAAREGEQEAKNWDKGSTTSKLYCARHIRVLSRLIEQFAATVAQDEEPQPIADSSDATGAASVGADATQPPMAGDDGVQLSSSSSSQSPSPSSPSEDKAGEGRVLIVDDSQLAGDHLRDVLQESGFEARLATNQLDALTELVSFAPCLVVCDVHMPGVDLDTLCRELRTRAAAPISIVLLSGMSEPELARRASVVGADGYVSKHAGIERVVADLRAAVQGGTR